MKYLLIMNHWSIFHKFTEHDMDTNEYYYENIEILKNQIETFPKQHQLHILKLIRDNDTHQISQNKNGVFINLTNLPLSIIQKIGDYSAYVVKQERDLQERENKVDEFATNFDQV